MAGKSRNLRPLTKAEEQEVIQDWKARFFCNSRTTEVIQRILDAAMDDDHKNQAVAWKLIMPRILPESSFAEANSSKSTPQISINISTRPDEKEISIQSGAGEKELIMQDGQDES